jgi:PAS domain S-box-containing protein/putative nucleotidyltransferase with HDIG domain
MAAQVTRLSSARHSAPADAVAGPLFGSNPLPMLIYDVRTLAIIAVNDAIVESYGYARKELLSMTIEDIRPHEDRAKLRAYIGDPDDRRHRSAVWRHRQRDGSIIDVRTESSAVEFDGRMVRLVALINMTQTLKAERAVNRNESRLNSMLHLSQRASTFTEAEIFELATSEAAALTDSTRAHLHLVRRPEAAIELVATVGANSGAAAFGASDSARITETARDCATRGTPLVDNSPVHVPSDGTAFPPPSRRVCVPIFERSECVMVIDAQGKASDYDDADARQLMLIGDAVWRIVQRKRAEDDVARMMARLERSIVGTITVISRIGEVHDPYTAGHERRVGNLAAAIGEEMGLPSNQVTGLRLIGYLHDIGKISVPVQLLAKPAPLTELERELVRQHARVGHEILRGVDFPWPMAEAVRQHHERLDGSGYPDALKGDQILLEARIVAVADVVEAMASQRSYRASLGTEAALAEIEEGAGSRYDERVVLACIRLFRDKAYRL